MIQTRFTRSFAAAHRVWNDPGACRNIHGHNYTADIHVTGDRLDSSGFLIQFSVVKKIVDEYDHALIVHQEDPLLAMLNDLGVRLVTTMLMPSTENLALMILTSLKAKAPDCRITTTLREGPSIEATAWA